MPGQRLFAAKQAYQFRLEEAPLKIAAPPTVPEPMRRERAAVL